jgi:hypothetical protein
MFHKVRDIIRSQGMLGLAHRSIAYAYRRGVRPWIPGRPVQYSGITICHDQKWGDRLVPPSWVLDAARRDKPYYEASLIAGLSETVKPGDNVVIVGAGVGVTAVAAALRASPSGTVQCFEGSKEHVRYARQTAARNEITNIIVHHAVVAKAISVFGSGSNVGDLIPPSQLPPCNVLQLDCEGAEVEMLREMMIQPRVILVETHGVFGAPTALVASLLEKRGYAVSDRGLAEPHATDHCTKNDIRVLLGTIHRE